LAAHDAGACTYVLLAGLPGTGKSTLAKALAARLLALNIATVILNKDDVRAALFPGVATDYSETQNALCIDAMLSAANYLRSSPSAPRFIFFDGRTFSRASQIEHILSAAETASRRCDWRILHLVCTDEAAEQRLATAEDHPAADRSFKLYLSLKKTFERITRVHLVLDTTLPMADSVRSSLSYLSLSDPSARS
jgi:predicted kinase